VKILKKGNGSKVTFYVWYILCVALCLFYKFSGNDYLQSKGTFLLVFEALSQGLLIGSLILNLKDVKNILGTVLKKRKGR
jgi:FtsH-binding integral membrane protein